MNKLPLFLTLLLVGGYYHLYQRSHTVDCITGGDYALINPHAYVNPLDVECDSENNAVEGIEYLRSDWNWLLTQYAPLWSYELLHLQDCSRLHVEFEKPGYATIRVKTIHNVTFTKSFYYDGVKVIEVAD